MPPAWFFLTSAVFHYLGPALAVLLFAQVSASGVAWLRIASAAVVFAAWRRPWRVLRHASAGQRRVLLSLGVVLAAMNTIFYLAVARLPLSTVGAIEFLGTVVLAAAGARTPRNMLALALAAGGVAVLTGIRIAGQLPGFAFAFGNCAGFVLYVVLGHRVATTTPGGDARDDPRAAPLTGIDQLGAAMLVAAVAATPLGIMSAVPAFTHPVWLAWGVGIGLCSSVIPYVSDQLAMARLPRATFALMLALLPAAATVIGLIVLAQVPTWRDLLGVGLVIAGLAAHREGHTAVADGNTGKLVLHSNEWQRPGRRILEMMKPVRAATRRFLPGSPFNVLPATPPVEQFAVQDQVTHDKYGLGRVISVEDDTALVVDFGSRKVRILSPFAKLTKL